MSLNKRIARLEAKKNETQTRQESLISEVRYEQWRAQIAPYLEGTRYDTDREAILAALCGADGDGSTLTYSISISISMRLEDDPDHPGWLSITSIDWAGRDVGEEPNIFHMFYPHPAPEPI